MMIMHRVLHIATSFELAFSNVQVLATGSLLGNSVAACRSLSQRARQLLVGSMLAPHAAPVAGASRVACTCARLGNQIPSSKCSYLCGLQCRDKYKKRKQVVVTVRDAPRKTENAGAKQGSGQKGCIAQNTRQWRWQ